MPDTNRLFYWLGARYDTALLIQAGLTILVQLVLLKVALDGRPSPGATMSQPFAGAQGTTQMNRPFDFWQWRWQRPYWMFLAYYTAVLFALQIIIGTQPWFVELQGYVALGIEATLPLPQILSNHRNKSCKGFRLSVLINWLIGDAFKMTFFFLSQSTIPWTFKLCGLFQAGCDAFLGVQYWMFGEGEATADLLEKDTRLS